MIKKLFLESNFLFFLRKQNFSLVVALVLLFILTIAGCESKIEDLIGMGTSEESVVEEEIDAVVESTNVEKKFSKIEEKTLLLEDPEIEKTILKKDELRVGLLLPLSGSDSFLGNALLKSAQMAIFDNKNDEIYLYPLDTKGNPQGARKAAEKAIEHDVHIIIGPVFSNSVFAISKIMKERNIPIIALSTDKKVSGDGVYLMGFMPDDPINTVVAYAADQGCKDLGAVIPNNNYGKIVYQILEESSAINNISFIKKIFIDPQSKDFSEEIKKFSNYPLRHAALLERRKELIDQEDEYSKKALSRLENIDTLGDPPFNCVFLPFGGRVLKTVATLLAFYDVDPKKIKFLGTMQWADVSLGTEPPLLGGWFAAPELKRWSKFVSRYKDYFNETPLRLSSIVYDSISLIFHLYKDESDKESFPSSNLANQNGFSGLDGIFRFTSEGITERNLAILEVQRGNLKVIQKPDTAFNKD